MSMVALRWARTVRHITSSQKLVLLLLADAANDHAEAWPSALTLAADACLSDRTVRSALDDLERQGLISGVRSYGRAARWTLNIGAAVTPEMASDVAETASGDAARTSETAEAVSGRKMLPRRSENGSASPRKLFPRGSEATSDRTPINPKQNPQGTQRAHRSQGPVVRAVDLPPWLPSDTWAAWSDYRLRKSGKAWTQHAAELSLRDLRKFRDSGHDPQAVIEQSIAAGWSGLFPLRRPDAGRADSRRLQNQLLDRMMDDQNAQPDTDMESLA